MFSNQSRYYISSRQGITIISTGSVDDSTAKQKTQDQLLNFVIKNFEHKAPGLPVLILLGPFGIHVPKKDFATIAYKEFGKDDTVYIAKDVLQGYRDMYHLEKDQNWTLHEMVPYEVVDSIYKGTVDVKGLVIRVYGTFATADDYHNKILSLTEYAIDNLEEIKNQQRYELLPYHMSGTTISVLTIDRVRLKGVKIKQFGFVPKL
ncbi:hypothetical protein [Paraflavitalea sp. CAU 1676]|uniref:hypothetical protein n=1 Tax=Paraflavitalea sp. CAU 1676 TaxID=3032598 RepID=UPI0023DB962E|nr:hypothetical protein [Paraflavitalea sp. CAU 1676]MDF2191689.1 hypothetical protein [Paraflavitalea sp. CAU 1676]